jgi:putative ABC transport system permease protein
MKPTFLLRWAWRDLRLRWLQVVAIALIIALGTSVFAGLGGQESWRIESMDMSYEALQMHDIRVRLVAGSLVSQDEALAVLEAIDGVQRIEPRMILDTLVDASTDDETILVSGQLVGVDVNQGGPYIDRIHIDADGRSLTAEDSGGAVLELKFARYYGLAPGARFVLAGGHELEVIGLGQSPEYFQIMPADQTGFAMMGESDMAVVFVPLTWAQEFNQSRGMVNTLTFSLDEGADREAARAEIERRLADAFPTIGVQTTYGEDDPVRTFLYADAEEDQVMLNMIALAFLLGAALAAFNLAGRIVESQRRQIGIGMAMGMPRLTLAIRPLLMGLQIAIIGTVLGLLFGLGFTHLFGVVTTEFMPLPYWAGTLLHPPSFMRAAALGVILPVVATLIPVWRAVRAEPLEAIHGHLTARSSGLNRWLKGVHLPGNSFAQMPLRNALRSPRRTLLTALGISAAVMLLIMFFGLLDTFVGTLDQSTQAFLYRSPERMIVSLNSFYPVEHEYVRGVTGLRTDDGRPLLAEIEPRLMLGGHLSNEEQEIETLIEFVPADSPLWTPNIVEGNLRRADNLPAIVISQKMADDLGVSVGDTLTMNHPRREGLAAFGIVSSTLRVGGIHDNPIRGFSYIEMENDSMTGLSGMTNVLVAMPGDGVRADQVRQALFGHPAVVATQAAADLSQSFDDLLSMFILMLRIIQGVVLLMAFLIAFNSTSINIDDRMREVATLFAFGVRPRTVMWTQIGENLILGVLGTAIGGWLGWVALNRMLIARMDVMLEEIGMLIMLSPISIIAGLVLGVAVVGLTPLTSMRKLARIDIPSTLRVME